MKTRSPAGKTIADALAFALIQARPGGENGRDMMLQWETDVLAVSMALALLFGIDDTRFRRRCQGPKGDRT